MLKTDDNLSPPLDPDASIRLAVRNAIRGCALSRAQIADELSIRLGQRITVFMLNAYTSEAKGASRFPACFIEAFCEITESNAVLLAVLNDRQRWLLRLGELAERPVLAVSRKKNRK